MAMETGERSPNKPVITFDLASLNLQHVNASFSEKFLPTADFISSKFPDILDFFSWEFSRLMIGFNIYISSIFLRIVKVWKELQAAVDKLLKTRH